MTLHVFGGPSLSSVEPVDLQRVEVLPPAKRGDLLHLAQLHEEPGMMLLVDGLFGLELAVTPRECLQVMQKGWTLCGCSSMGALRAADLYAEGMLGFGEVFAWIRLGRLVDESDLAVVFHPDMGSELTIAGVVIRQCLTRLVRQGVVDDEQASRAVDAARGISWSERTWARLEAQWLSAGLGTLLQLVREESAIPGSHPKQRDAREAIRILANLPAMGASERTLRDLMTAAMPGAPT